ncbi:pyridine nucleotide-disulfide oxidoreductase, putative [Trichomonas vaginalis G3]|uniref:Pyridine nucleotide-disulphide oxidoreductase, putative n=1 Tax=Trichomonas vaginalis (strain ATCC PRA-98 / G3) TaxID=412133 RepID=A2DBA4_TRIV3|nr:disulfide oxidoreductase family [Trichomonas vaginalis G3]EAY22434.1 pyridine nucleotide-disulfide oxidoreductase, putative [Trichomonas vaginalis G3]KAI5517619.1 disulfide oxidoreductase family [Trichomonas vaginalis G3]|eukprot:XP_001583420.1 pyridine nucleotide-disulphide oxidoreductase [Trichomonas vaginalis G3]
MSHKVYEANHEFENFGIKVPGDVTVDMALAQQKKNDILEELSSGIEDLIERAGGDLVHGTAIINSKNDISVTLEDGKTITYNPKNLLIATGTDKWFPKTFPVDEEIIATSQGVLNWKEIPKTLTVVGGGIIGLELGSIFHSLGSKVTIVDMAPTIGGPSVDPSIGRFMQDILEKRGMEFVLGKGVDSCTKTENGVEVVIGDQKLQSERALIAIGRRLHLDGFGLEKLNLKRLKNGLIEVNDRFETSEKNVYAIGDIVPGPQLAQKAEEEGIACVEMLAGLESSYNPNVIPSVIYTNPEIATVGLTENNAAKQALKIKVGMFPYSANSRARIICDPTGFVKFVCGEDGTVLGMQIVGPNAGEAIMEGAIAIRNKLKIDAIAETCHPHPTLSEAVLEAAKTIISKTIHI